MPPQASLPLRDGRVGLQNQSSTSAGSQQYEANCSDEGGHLLLLPLLLFSIAHGALPFVVQVLTPFPV
jgi:hypothetical protein